MHDLLRIIGLVKDEPPQHVKSFEASSKRLNNEIGRLEKENKDAFASMIDDMVTSARKQRNATNSARRAKAHK